MPEIITPGRDGFLVESIDAACDAVEKLGAIDRQECRRTVEERFTARRMALDYIDVYNALVS